MGKTTKRQGSMRWKRKEDRETGALFHEGARFASGGLRKREAEGRGGPDERIHPALERKNVTVIRPQGEEKLAVASHWPEPRRRSERSPIPVRLDEPLETGLLFSLVSPVLDPFLSLSRPLRFSFLLFTFRCPLVTDRSRKITENDLSNGNFSVATFTLTVYPMQHRVSFLQWSAFPRLHRFLTNNSAIYNLDERVVVIASF